MLYNKGKKVFRKISSDLFVLATVSLLLTAGFITAVTKSPLCSGQAKPDLNLTSGDISYSNEQPMEYETITVYATIYNIGNVVATNIVVRFFVTNENNFTYEIGDSLISELDIGSSQQTQIDWIVGLPGLYEFKVCIDPENTISESEEYNNNASRNLMVQRFYILCEDNAHTIPVGQSTTYLITVKDNQFCFCIHNFSLNIIKPIFFSEWKSTLSTEYFDSGGGQITNFTLSVEVPPTTMGMPSAGMTAPIVVDATMRMGHEPYNTTYLVCTYTTAAGDGKINATIDIDPDTLNLKSKGKWISCYIDLPEGYDVNDIDISTLMLEDTIYADWGNIQNKTLMVKFDRSEVEDMLLPGTYNFKITGELTDGTIFEGYSDEIRVIDPP